MTDLRFGGLVLGICVGLSAGPAQERQAFVQWAVTEDFNANDPHNPLVVQDKVIVGTDRGELRAYRSRP
jgi:hypothetical protein